MKTKTKFIRTGIKLSLVALIFATTTAFVSSEKAKNSETVIVYGIVYVDKCGSEAYQYYAYEFANTDNYYEVQSELKASLESNYPSADRIRVSSSKYDYGNDARAMCIIKWQRESNDCYYEFAAVYFGETSTEASNKAVSEKNKWAGTNSNYTILKTHNW